MNATSNLKFNHGIKYITYQIKIDILTIEYD
jgi:hypothetical protein